MSSKYRISHTAILDLEEIWLYTLERWSKEQADIYYKSIIAEIENVAWDFERGKPITQIRAGYRSSKVNSHVVFYRKIDSDIVEIVRVLHKKMDWKRHLG